MSSNIQTLETRKEGNQEDRWGVTSTVLEVVVAVADLTMRPGGDSEFDGARRHGSSIEEGSVREERHYL
ncbi:hypothetical protein M6B38_112875 [Iris pallida]|uniref:Uncharacterized protein n=1 Tax=Iris pallida TaxID=29817 RepID=A0AAX6DNE5_IRIPA|nr:hypothetical protein M6B38_112875 [Iris pallida]